MREIKFRAWDEKCNSYIENPWRFSFAVFLFVDKVCTAEEIIIEQYTGLKDSTTWEDLTNEEREKWLSDGNKKEDWKGKEIYEGDILEIGGFHFNFPVRWCDSSLGFNISWVPENLNKGKIIKVIGNIHENLELSSFK